MSGNPFDGTRSEVTHAFLHEIPVPPPELRDPQWAEVFDSLRALFKALAEHDAMARNNSQLFSTPAHDKNAQYFCWDFVFRTISYCLRAAGQANPAPQNTDPVLHETWKDTVSRSVLITSLILADNPGQLAQMLEMTYPGHNPGGQPPMGHEVIAAAQRLKAGVTE